ncbi:hypothetical protein GA0061093_13210 [Rhodococcus qingshengii]|jgi:hypothetical protein|nr:hypothetical protein GA0061093_13210 [Rhodococcus qingshengii]
MALIPKGYRSHYAQTPRFPDIPLSVRQFGEALSTTGWNWFWPTFRDGSTFTPRVVPI